MILIYDVFFAESTETKVFIRLIVPKHTCLYIVWMRRNGVCRCMHRVWMRRNDVCRSMHRYLYRVGMMCMYQWDVYVQGMNENNACIDVCIGVMNYVQILVECIGCKRANVEKLPKNAKKKKKKNAKHKTKRKTTSFFHKMKNEIM